MINADNADISAEIEEIPLNMSLAPLPPRKLYQSESTIYDMLLKSRRLSGRGFEDIRSLCFQTDCISSAPGSAYVSIGNTKVISSVYGPYPAGKRGYHDRAKLNIDLKKVPFGAALRYHTSQESLLLFHLQHSLNSVVQLWRYPRSIIDVCIVILEDDGGTFTGSLTCIGLALVSASIGLNDIVSGISGVRIFFI